MSTTRNLYLTISLPGQNIEKIMDEHGLADFTVSNLNLLRSSGSDKNIVLNSTDGLQLVYSLGAYRQAKQLLKLVINHDLAAGVPIITVGTALGKDDLRYFKKIDPSFGYHIYLIDFIKPVLEKVQDDSELIDMLYPLTKEIYSRKKLSSYLRRYHNVNWGSLEWPILTPEELFKKLETKLSFSPNMDILSDDFLVIGDVHGDYDDLYEVLNAYPDTDTTLLGDYIDRGPQSGKVIRLLMERQHELFLLSGNHEINLRKKFIENRRTFGGLQLDTVDQLIDENLGENEVRKFLSSLDTYRAFSFNNRNLFLCHAGIEPLLLEHYLHDRGIELAPSETFLYGIKKDNDSVYNRDIDLAWMDYPVENTVMIHGHRNKFKRDVMVNVSNSSASINLADSDTSTFRYVLVHADKNYELHIRQRFSKSETILYGKI